MAAKQLLSYRRTTKKEGIATLVGVVFTVLGLIGSMQLVVDFSPNFAADEPWFYYLFNGVALLLGGLVIFCYAMPNLRMNREFRFTLTEDEIDCQSPTDAFGESYTIALTELVGIEERQSCDTSDWYLTTRDGRQYQLTPNYGNPQRDIMDALIELKPDLVVKRR